MAKRTFYVVQRFEAGKRGAIRPGQPMEAQTAEHADRMAQRLGSTKLGAIAFSRDVDPETDDADGPVLISTYGQVPDGILDAG